MENVLGSLRGRYIYMFSIVSENGMTWFCDPKQFHGSRQIAPEKRLQDPGAEVKEGEKLAHLNEGK